MSISGRAYSQVGYLCIIKAVPVTGNLFACTHIHTCKHTQCQYLVIGNRTAGIQSVYCCLWFNESNYPGENAGAVKTGMRKLKSNS